MIAAGRTNQKDPICSRVLGAMSGVLVLQKCAAVNQDSALCRHAYQPPFGVEIMPNNIIIINLK